MVNAILQFVKKGRQQLEDSLTRAGKAHTLSLARYRLHRLLRDRITNYAAGNCLDAGSGRSPFKALLGKQGSSLTSIDVEDRSGDVDLIGDIQSMPELSSDSFDTLLCSQVLEHVPRPWDAMGEFSRVLRPDGTLILSVPHLSVLHEIPHDYFRYTPYGLTSLCERAGLEVASIEPTGGLGCFFWHGFSSMLVSLFAGIPFLGRILLFLNYWLFVRLPDCIEGVVGLPNLYPCDLVLIARKPGSKVGGQD